MIADGVGIVVNERFSLFKDIHICVLLGSPMPALPLSVAALSVFFSSS